MTKQDIHLYNKFHKHFTGYFLYESALSRFSLDLFCFGNFLAHKNICAKVARKMMMKLARLFLKLN
jgi:hypothetical protein